MAEHTIYRSLKAVILDWAGTTVDHGSIAPIRTLQRVLSDSGIHVPDAIVRRDMGIAKLDHIRKLLSEPETVSAWREMHQAGPSEKDAEALYEQFLPLQMECLLDYSHVLPGVPEAVSQMRARGLKIGSTTGYTRPMLDRLLEQAQAEGYSPDGSLTPEDVGGGRPYPWMCYRLAIDLQVFPLWACVKVGDTPSDIAEGRNAGMWTVGIVRTGNAIGLSKSEWDELTTAEQATKLAAARKSLLTAGAHFVADSVAESLPTLDEIDTRLDRGERP